MKENRLKWFKHVLRREETEALRLVIEMYIEVRSSGRGKPKKQLFRQGRQCDMKRTGVNKDDAGDRVKWKLEENPKEDKKIVTFR